MPSHAVNQESLHEARHSADLYRMLAERKPHLADHSSRVAAYAMLIAARMGISRMDRWILRTAALLHDTGKVMIPDSTLERSGPLSADEWQLMRDHPVYSERLAEQYNHGQFVRNAIRHHHERWDGAGYPDSLAGEQIPFLARIIAVADAFDAMTSYRPYRRARSITEARHEIMRSRGTQFDPEVVHHFTALPQFALDYINASGSGIRHAKSS